MKLEVYVPRKIVSYVRTIKRYRATKFPRFVRNKVTDLILHFVVHYFQGIEEGSFNSYEIIITYKSLITSRRGGGDIALPCYGRLYIFGAIVSGRVSHLSNDNRRSQRGDVAAQPRRAIRSTMVFLLLRAVARFRSQILSDRRVWSSWQPLRRPRWNI